METIQPKPGPMTIVKDPPLPDPGFSDYMSAEVDQLFPALVRFQSELEPITRDSKGHYKNPYTSLDAVIEGLREPLKNNGLFMIQGFRRPPQGAVMWTMIGHGESCQWIRSEIPLVPEKKDIHTLCSLISYMRRYTAKAMAGVSDTDDDGNKAMGLK